MKSICLLLLTLCSGILANLLKFSQLTNENQLFLGFPPDGGAFVISDGRYDEVLKTITISQPHGNVTKTAFELSKPDANGKLTPFLNDNIDYSIQISTKNGTNYDIPGYIYIVNSAPSVYVQQDGNNNLKISSAGTNIFFSFNIQGSRIPVVTDLSVPQGSTVKAFVGVPENGFPVFDSSLFNSSFSYNQLDFPVDYFYLTSSDAKVSYTVGSGIQLNNLTTDSLSVSGLLMTTNYPANVTSTQNTFTFSNKNSATAFVHLYPYFINIPDAVYTTNFTITSGGQVQTFPASSQSVYFDLQLRTQLNKIVVSSDGQYAVQFVIQDLSPTTTQNPVQSTTKDLSPTTTQNPVQSTTKDLSPTTTQNPVQSTTKDLSQTTTQHPVQSTTKGAESISRIFSVLVVPLVLLKLF